MGIKVESQAATTVHPLQANRHPYRQAKINTAVTLRAYEVYCHLFQPQPALVEGNCRGGFGIGELSAFLYARSFPKAEWDQRFHEALEGMENQ